MSIFARSAPAGISIDRSDPPIGYWLLINKKDFYEKIVQNFN
jgi:hypothetical protein